MDLYLYLMGTKGPQSPEELRQAINTSNELISNITPYATAIMMFLLLHIVITNIKSRPKQENNTTAVLALITINLVYASLIYSSILNIISPAIPLFLIFVYFIASFSALRRIVHLEKRKVETL